MRQGEATESGEVSTKDSMELIVPFSFKGGDIWRDVNRMRGESSSRYAKGKTGLR